LNPGRWWKPDNKQSERRFKINLKRRPDARPALTISGNLFSGGNDALFVTVRIDTGVKKTAEQLRKSTVAPGPFLRPRAVYEHLEIRNQ
jgi:hypothetical protein